MEVEEACTQCREWNPRCLCWMRKGSSASGSFEGNFNYGTYNFLSLGVCTSCTYRLCPQTLHPAIACLCCLAVFCYISTRFRATRVDNMASASICGDSSRVHEPPKPLLVRRRTQYKRLSSTSWECAVDVDEVCKDPSQASSTQCKQHRQLELQSCEIDPITLHPIPSAWLIRLYLLYEDSNGRQERTLRCFDVRTLQIYIAEVPSARRAFSATQLQRIKSFRPNHHLDSTDNPSSSQRETVAGVASSVVIVPPKKVNAEVTTTPERQAMYTWLLNGQYRETEAERVKMKRVQSQEIKQLLVEQQKEEALQTQLGKASPEARRVRRAQHINTLRRTQERHREEARAFEEHAAFQKEKLLRELPNHDLDTFLAQFVF